MNNQYEYENSLSELLDEERIFKSVHSEEKLKAIYGILPMNKQLYNQLIVDLTTLECFSILDILYERYKKHFR